MKKQAYLLIIIIFTVFYGTGILCMEADTKISFEPVKHATFVIKLSGYTIYVDPVGDQKDFAAFPRPDMILITDNHRDHLNVSLVNALRQEKTAVIGPGVVIEALTYGKVVNNGDDITVDNLRIQAIPMYNSTPDRLKFHPKGRGNGYVITSDQKKIYISGDTEDIPEMRQLKDIDYAFVCMNLPYTMTVEQAASAVLEMNPGIVFPYHYRGKDGMSDIKKFETLVQKKGTIRVELLNWYN